MTGGEQKIEKAGLRRAEGAKGIGRFRRETGGSLALVMALALAAIGVAVGLALDFANAVNARARLQNAIDAAVLAAAADAGPDWKTNAERTLAVQLRPGDLVDLDTTFTRDAGGVITGTATRDVETYFAGLLSASYVRVAVDAAAGSAGQADPVCILVKSKTAGQALLVNSGAEVNASGCQIHVASTANPAAIFNASSDIQSKKLCVAGNDIIDNGGHPANLEKNCRTVDDPFEGKLPSPGSPPCTFHGNNWDGGSVTMKPGVYCGWYNFNGAPTVNFEPGLYVIRNGGFNVNGGTWNGDGVTFYFADSSNIQFNSAVRAYLKAPKSGPYAGILFYEAENLGQSHFVLNDSAGHALEGLIYLPSRNMTINSGYHATLDKVTLVTNTLILNAMSWNIGPAERKPINTAGGGSGAVRLMR